MFKKLKEFFSDLFITTERGLFTLNTSQADLEAKEAKSDAWLLENGIVKDINSGLYLKDGKPLFFIDGRESDNEMKVKLKLFNETLKAHGYPPHELSIA